MKYSDFLPNARILTVHSNLINSSTDLSFSCPNSTLNTVGPNNVFLSIFHHCFAVMGIFAYHLPKSTQQKTVSAAQHGRGLMKSP
ncbi:hypothetical protein CPB83DRAFT_854075 [Crepidotus variabilis]|uniref:Uncharacterized protein n=1 Tax=Crepidotus variabilis TaxID=179855 RepID=A0A9P6JQA5_9AGAR|nr:hypothetical protein CPB83DRAFT_854075 [Crepidotus variabilis]